MCRYPSSLFRIIVSSKLHLPGFFDFMNTDYAWRFKFPATLVFFFTPVRVTDFGQTYATYIQFIDRLGFEVSSRPNFQFLRNSNDFAAHLYSFAQFLPWNACQFSVNHQVILIPSRIVAMFVKLFLMPYAECVLPVAHRPPTRARTSLQLHE